MDQYERPSSNGRRRAHADSKGVSKEEIGRATAEARCQKVIDELEPGEHRRVLAFLNDAVAPEDLMFRRGLATDGTDPRARRPHAFMPSRTRRPVIARDAARALLEFRNKEYPLGFRHIRETLAAKGFSFQDLIELLQALSKLLFGSWTVFPQPIPRRGPGDYDGVVHAALLHTGKVLFITADETTLLWDPQNTAASTFENPVNQPHLTPTGEGYSVLCGGHCFLSSGQLLVVGGGGYSAHHLARWGYRFDPVAKSWARTAGPMVEDRWYPTALRLGDYRVGASREVLVVCGHGHGDMEIYDEASDSFRVIEGDTKQFPRLYPGLHLLPNHAVLYTRTGWGSPEPNGPQGNVADDDQSAYFTMNGPSAGVWTNTGPSATKPDRTKGMSVLLLSRDAPYVRTMVLGGADPANNDTYEIIDATALSTTVSWGPAHTFPDREHRSLASAVLLPDGTVFVCGGIQRANSPCAVFDPRTNQWSAMAALPSIRDYHSVALLLPSAEVMMAGWNNTAIEIYKPPYLFKGARPTIQAAPAQVRHGETFSIDTPDAASIRRVVLIRPMAVTHQTDTEQRVIELGFDQAGGGGARLVATAPDGGPPYSLAPQGHYMLFIVNQEGVPSVASWIYLAPPDFHFWSLSAVSQAAGGPTAAGDPFGYMFDAQGTQHILYRSNDGHIRELWWDGGWHAEDLTAATGAPAAAGDPRGYMFDAQGTQHVIFRSNDGHIRELWWDGSWHAEDLTAATGAPSSASEPTGYMFDAQGTQHIIFRSNDGHIRELWWNGTWHAEDLTGATGAPAAVGIPHAYMFNAQGTQHVIFRSGDGHIRELWWDGAWHAEDLTGATGAPLAAGDPCGYMFDAQGTQHVVFRSTDGHIRELWWDGAWHAEDLTGATGAPNAASDPSAYMFDAQGTQHVIFRSNDGHIRELWWDGSWHAEDLTAATQAPPASGKPHGYMFDAQGSQHVVYRGTDGQVYELWWL